MRRRVNRTIRQRGGRGRKFQAGGHSHWDPPYIQTMPGGTNTDSYGQHSHWVNMTSGSQGSHQHPGGINPRPGSPYVPHRGRRGGRVRHQLRRGGRAPVRRFQQGGSGECPVGTQRSAYGTCLPMDA